MKILLIHNYYSQGGGGEDSVFEAEAALLRSHGHEVITFVRSNKEILEQGRIAALKALIHSKFNRKIYSEVRALCEKEHPDVAHVHNFWFALSPSVHAACHDAGVTVVQTLHNFRLICLNALLLRNDSVCRKCVGRRPWPGILHRCYRNSFLQSWFACRMVSGRVAMMSKVDVFLTLTHSGMAVFKEAGFPSEKLFYKPNFIRDRFLDRRAPLTVGRALYAGRLTKDKGVETLMNAWPDRSGIELVLAGEGPLRGAIEKNLLSRTHQNIALKGLLNSEEVAAENLASSFLILPSEWYETFGLVMVESFSAGRPVVASRHGAMAEIVKDGETGLLFEPGNVEDLAEKIEWMLSHPDECRRMGENARREYEEKYSPEKNHEMLMEIYRTAIARRAEA